MSRSRPQSVMSEMISLPPNLLRCVSVLARPLVAPGRSRAICPPEHPAFQASVGRIGASAAPGGVQISAYA